MTYAVRSNSQWRELPVGADIVVEDIATSYASMLAWTPQFRTARGIKEIEEAPPQAGKVIVSSSIEDQGGKPVRVYVLADAPIVTDPAPEALPDLSKRQFYQGLATDWKDPDLPMFPVISQAEALDALKTGEVPGAMQAVIDSLPPAMVFPVTSIVIGAASYQRSSPLVDSFAASKQMTGAQVSKFWNLASAL